MSTTLEATTTAPATTTQRKPAKPRGVPSKRLSSYSPGGKPPAPPTVAPEAPEPDYPAVAIPRADLTPNTKTSDREEAFLCELMERYPDWVTPVGTVRDDVVYVITDPHGTPVVCHTDPAAAWGAWHGIDSPDFQLFMARRVR